MAFICAFLLPLSLGWSVEQARTKKKKRRASVQKDALTPLPWSQPLTPKMQKSSAAPQLSTNRMWLQNVQTSCVWKHKVPPDTNKTWHSWSAYHTTVLFVTSIILCYCCILLGRENGAGIWQSWPHLAVSPTPPGMSQDICKYRGACRFFKMFQNYTGI